MFGPEVIAAIKADGIARYPEEACGLVTADGYVPFPNVADDPRRHFEMPVEALSLIAAGGVLAVAHSHPDGPAGPSLADQQQQIAMGIPWGIVVVRGEMAEEPIWWGPGIPDQPYSGRDFRWGPTGTDGKGDCFALVHDWYRRERGLVMRERARDGTWQDHSPLLYEDGWKDEGFTPVFRQDLQPGDAILFSIRNKGRLNHAGVFVGDGVFLHHPANRLSEATNVVTWLFSSQIILRPPA